VSARERRRADRRRQICDTALEIVVEEGIDALTMPGLAKRLGVAVGGLYRYFPSKDRLVLAMELEAIDAYARFAAERTAEVPGDDVEALLRATLATWMDFAVAEPVLYRLLEALTADPRLLLSDEESQELQAHLEPIFGRIVAVLDRAVHRGVLAPGDNLQRVYVLWGTLQGLLLFRKQDARRPPALKSRALAEAAIDALVTGWDSARP
jgi:AcrR family transcriptional regulator